MSSHPLILIAYVLHGLVLLILLDVVVSWAQMFGATGISSYTPWVRTLRKITNPILDPFRKLWDWILTSLGRSFRLQTYMLRRLDLSPLLAILCINLVQGLLYRAAG